MEYQENGPTAYDERTVTGMDIDDAAVAESSGIGA